MGTENTSRERSNEWVSGRLAGRAPAAVSKASAVCYGPRGRVTTSLLHQMDRRDQSASSRRVALVAAQLTGAPLVPIAVGGTGIWRLNSWDRLVIPKPFAQITVKYGRPVFIPRGATEQELEDCALQLEEVLNRDTDELDQVSREPANDPANRLRSAEGRSGRSG